MKRLHGVVCASITPMTPDGQVDQAGVRALFQHLAKAGIHCLYPNGTNGESLSLTQQEREMIAKIATEEVKDQMTVYIQCGAATVPESYSHVLHAREIGADGAGLMTPVFFPVDETGMEQYYQDILNQTGDFPVYIYNISSRTGNDVSAALLSRLMDQYPALLGVKFSCPDLLRLTEYITCNPNRTADLLIGCDQLALECVSGGGVGWVSGPAAVFTHVHVQLYDALCKGDFAKALEIQRKITYWMAQIKGIPEIPAIKYMLKRMGVIANDTCRMPLRALNAEEKARLDQVLDAYQKSI